jgi:sarcosine oxidase subunit alpha
VAGLGRLPSEVEPARDARRSERAVLVVGTGAAGLCAATELGKNALAVDDALAPGGSLALLDPKASEELVEKARAAGAELRLRTTALGLYREPAGAEDRIRALLVGPEGAELVLARAVVLAPGEHDPVPAFGGNDLPGVMSARAGLKLLTAGVAPASRVALVGDGRFSKRFAELCAGRIETFALDVKAVVRGIGRARLTGVVTSQGKHAAGALLFDGPGAPSFELGAQAGGLVTFDKSRGYSLERDPSGRVAEHVYVARDFDDGARVAQAAARAIGIVRA